MNAVRAKARAVVVTRPSWLTLLLERHGTLGQAEFYLRSRGESIADYVSAHERFEEAMARVLSALEPDRRRTRVSREDLERFLFAEDDVVLVVGQDGLVPNAAKYLSGQPVIGVNPDPQRYDGVLCAHRPESVGDILAWLAGSTPGGWLLQHRVMAQAEREDGQKLLALNEVFVGHRSHQSARYRLRATLEGSEHEERQSSSGLICATGTGCTGWARSIAGQVGGEDELPGPEAERLAWFVREPFPSVSTGTSMSKGSLSGTEQLVLVSEMSEGGVLFADGIETDRIEFVGGQAVRIGLADRTLNLVMPAPVPAPGRAATRTPGRSKGSRQPANGGTLPHQDIMTWMRPGVGTNPSA